MTITENKTKFIHKSMPSWGIGVCRRYDSVQEEIVIEFEKAGTKKFKTDCIGALLLMVGEHAAENFVNGKSIYLSDNLISSSIKIGKLRQFDGEAMKVAGKNVIVAPIGNDILVFNETYTIVGENAEGCKIHALYDLIILGDVSLRECVVNGALTIIGDAHINNLTCHKDLVCKGDVFSKKIYVGGNIIANSIDCDELICDGNVFVHTTANINETVKIDKTIVACEGIMGAGKFSAQNAIANDYFEFQGDYKGKILELSTETIVYDTIPRAVSLPTTLDEILDLANQKLLEKIGECPSLDEIKLKEFLYSLNAKEVDALKNVPIFELIFSRLVEISYQERIETVDDYLTVLLAQKILPAEIFEYESVEHVGKLYLSKAHGSVATLKFEPANIEQFAETLNMAVELKDRLNASWKIIMEKIFESVGIKYSTVSSVIEKSLAIKVEPTHNTQTQVDENLRSVAQPTPVAPMKKAELLEKKLSLHGEKVGLTDMEIERLASVQIKTFGDFVSASDDTLTKALGKKAFLAGHLIDIKNKIIAKLANME